MKYQRIIEAVRVRGEAASKRSGQGQPGRGQLAA
jgi:hypothetical protein